MKFKSLGILLIPFLVPLFSCGPNQDTPAKDSGLIGNKLKYNGRFDNFDFDPDTEPRDFLEALSEFYDEGASEFRQDLTDNLTLYFVPNDNIERRTPDLYTYFGNESTKKTLTYKNKEVDTYLINNFEGGFLCRYGKDPDNENVYHFYNELENNTCEIARVVDKYMLGNPLHLIVTDDGFTYSDNQIKILFNVTIKYDDMPNLPMNASMFLYLGNGKTSDVEVIEQPKDIHVNYPSNPDELKFSLKVNHPEKVISYSWYIGAYSAPGYATSFSEIDSAYSHSKDLTLLSVGCAQSRIPVKCLIRTEKYEIFSGIADIYVDNFDQYVPVVYLLDYPIMAGETLDLSDTPYGSGKIIYNENQTDITFDNVNFNNANIDSGLESLGFALQNFANPHSTYNFNFIGKNVWNNQYWEEDNHQGGLGFFIHFGGKSVKPVINFKGPGDITFIGGSRAVSTTNVKLHIFNDINVVGLPNRLTGGIFADDITIESGATVSGIVGNAILYAIRDTSGFGKVTIKEGARVNAIINPGNVSVDETQIFGIRGVFGVEIKKAYVNISVAVNYDYFFNLQQTIMPIEGIYSDFGFVDIIDSDVYVDVRSLNVPNTSVATIVNSISGIGGLAVGIANSNVNIKIDSYAFCNIYAINGGCVEIENSIVNVYARGIKNVKGVYCPFKKDRSTSGVFYVKNSKVDIYADAYLFEKDEFGKIYYIDAGVAAVAFDFDLDNESYIHIKTNRASALLSIYEHAVSEVKPVASYVPTQILLDNVNVKADSYEINHDSYKSFSPSEEPRDFYVVYEAMYVPETSYQSYLTEILISKK